MLSLLKRKKKDIEPLPQYVEASLLDYTLFRVGENDAMTIGNACEGIHVFGGTGSGKTSGSGRELSLSFLECGMGGLVLTAKPDEINLWRNYCKQAGREEDLIIFAPDQPHTFNFLNYECTRDKSKGGGQTENIVNILIASMEALERGKNSSGGDPFWERTARQLARNA